MKKLLITALLLLCPVLAFASAPDLVVGSVITSPGQTITVPISVDLTVPIISAGFDIKYDATVLTPTTITIGDGNAGWNIVSNPNVSGTIRVGLYSSSSISGSPQIALVNFTVISSKTTTISVSKITFDAAAISATTSGLITINIPGDVNGDGVINALDASLVAQDSIGLINFSPAQDSQGDVSGDGTVTMYDAALIAEYAAGIINKFH